MWHWFDCLPLSWRVSSLTPPHTIAPRRPFPMGIASVQCFAGPENVSFKGLELSVSTKLGFHRSLSVGGRTITQSPSSITSTIKTPQKVQRRKKERSFIMCALLCYSVCAASLHYQSVCELRERVKKMMG